MSAIEWTDKTWNPIAGCDRLSPGCDNCYAIGQARRCEGFGHAKYKDTTIHTNGGLDWSGIVNFDPDALLIPYKAKKPTIWFVNSMSDIGHHEVTEGQVKAIFEVMNKTPHHHYQILTKRPSRIVKIADQLDWTPNIWFGVSVENVKYGGQRLKELRKIPAAIRFVSAEPLLGDVSGLDYSDIHWIIAGGESGVSWNKIRPMDADWVRNLRDTCRAHRIPFFFKQWGNYDEKGLWHKSKAETGHLIDGQEFFEMPAIIQSLISEIAPAVQKASPCSKADYQAQILTLLSSSPMTASQLREANNVKDRGATAVHSHALIQLKKERKITVRRDGRYGLLVSAI